MWDFGLKYFKSALAGLCTEVAALSTTFFFFHTFCISRKSTSERLWQIWQNCHWSMLHSLKSTIVKLWTHPGCSRDWCLTGLRQDFYVSKYKHAAKCVTVNVWLSSTNTIFVNWKVWPHSPVKIINICPQSMSMSIQLHAKHSILCVLRYFDSRVSSGKYLEKFP